MYTFFAPLEKASIPIPPDPEHKSRKYFPSIFKKHNTEWKFNIVLIRLLITETYTIAKMFEKNIQNNNSNIIYFAGVLHIQLVKNFISTKLKIPEEEYYNPVINNLAYNRLTSNDIINFIEKQKYLNKDSKLKYIQEIKEHNIDGSLFDEIIFSITLLLLHKIDDFIKNVRIIKILNKITPFMITPKITAYFLFMHYRL